MFYATSQSKTQTMTALHDETLVGLAYLKGIGDLAWSFDAFNDKQINSDPKFDMLFRSYFNFNPNYTFVNIFNQPIA